MQSLNQTNVKPWIKQGLNLAEYQSNFGRRKKLKLDT